MATDGKCLKCQRLFRDCRCKNLTYPYLDEPIHPNRYRLSPNEIEAEIQRKANVFAQTQCLTCLGKLGDCLCEKINIVPGKGMTAEPEVSFPPLSVDDFDTVIAIHDHVFGDNYDEIELVEIKLKSGHTVTISKDKTVIFKTEKG